MAIWLWCRERRSASASWKYKKDSSILAELWGLLLAIPQIGVVLSQVSKHSPKSDDELDARVAYALGRLWLDNPGSVTLLGSADHGAFLLPKVSNIEGKLSDFVRLPQ